MSEEKKELNEKDLEKVSGGTTNTIEQGPKYAKNQVVRYYRDDYQIQGTIRDFKWADNKKQYKYEIEHGYYNIILGGVIKQRLDPGVDYVYESEIIY